MILLAAVVDETLPADNSCKKPPSRSIPEEKRSSQLPVTTLTYKDFLTVTPWIIFSPLPSLFHARTLETIISQPSVLTTKLVNSTSPALVSPPAFGMSYFTMTLGALSNLTALAILAHSYARLRRRAKAPFLLLASALLVSDLAGHVITGALALHLHLGRVKYHRVAVIVEPPQVYCKLFGGCMVFFWPLPSAARQCDGSGALHRHNATSPAPNDRHHDTRPSHLAANHRHGSHFGRTPSAKRGQLQTTVPRHLVFFYLLTAYSPSLMPASLWLFPHWGL